MMQALQAATGLALRKRPASFKAKPPPGGDGREERMPSYEELVGIFGEGLLPHTLPGDGVVKTASRARAPSGMSTKPVYAKHKISVVKGGGSIGSLYL